MKYVVRVFDYDLGDWKTITKRSTKTRAFRVKWRLELLASSHYRYQVFNTWTGREATNGQRSESDD